jgi:hypothetical protein
VHAYALLAECCGGVFIFRFDTTSNMKILSVMSEENKMPSRCSGNKNRLRTFESNFNVKWESGISTSMLITNV